MALLFVPSRTPGSTTPKPGRFTVLDTPWTQAFGLKAWVTGSNGQHVGILPLASPLYITQAVFSCRMLFMHDIRWALVLAIVSAGSNNAAKIAMMAITTSNSISVNARFVFVRPIFMFDKTPPKQLRFKL